MVDVVVPNQPFEHFESDAEGGPLGQRREDAESLPSPIQCVQCPFAGVITVVMVVVPVIVIITRLRRLATQASCLVSER